jgi:bifunctional non-homologous end joining protein LigD
LSKTVPTAGDWIYEIKFDGYRILSRIERGKVKLITRNGNDWTSKLRSLAAEVESLGVTSGWLDGEVVVLNEDGTPNFNALQNAFDASRTDSIVYFLFDAPYFEGYDLRAVPLYARRELLRKLLDEKGSERVRFSAGFEAPASSVLQSACSLKLEGVIAKRRDAHYVSERSDSWLKLKCSSRQEFVIGGFSDRTGAPGEVGALLLGVHDDQGRLLHVGSVGTGWDHETGRELRRKLAKLEVDKSPFDPSAPAKPGRWSKRDPANVHWLKPQAVAEVSFAEWTPDGSIRHASFVSLRTDKPAEAITRERATEGPAPASPRDAVSGVKVSNPDRVIDPSTGIKKLDLVRYYESVAGFILPHLQGRPTSLVRAPSGITGELFFQKHPEKLKIPDITELDPKLWPGHASLLEINSVEALVGAAQMNVIEFHTWNALSKHIDQPDRFILDLDPGEGVTWPRLQEAAVLTRTLLEELELKAWLKTSGGKGLHVVVPIAPRQGWDVVKAFSQAVVQHMARVIPQRFVAKSGGSNRVGKIFIDYLRNGHGQTTACAFSARSRPGMGVSIPVAWEDLPQLKSGAQWTVLTAREYLSFQKDDPWADYWKTRQRLSGAMKALGFSAERSAAG